MTLEELRAKRQMILDIAARHGASNVRVFGSVARDEAGPDSDVDFLIDVVEPTRYTWGGGGLLMDLQDLLGCDVDISTETGLHQLIKDRVLQEAVAL